eukprot:1161696-Pelagomonas_calceolata.AAC.39
MRKGLTHIGQTYMGQRSKLNLYFVEITAKKIGLLRHLNLAMWGSAPAPVQPNGLLGSAPAPVLQHDAAEDAPEECSLILFPSINIWKNSSGYTIIMRMKGPGQSGRQRGQVSKLLKDCAYQFTTVESDFQALNKGTGVGWAKRVNYLSKEALKRV